MSTKGIILLIEDNLPIRHVLTEKLKHEGFSVLEAKNGNDGLALALEQKPDMILLDIVMPRMDGITMLQKLRADERGKDVPVFILTNLSDDESLAAALEAGSHQYLIKSDWSMEDIIERIKEVIG